MASQIAFRPFAPSSTSFSLFSRLLRCLFALAALSFFSIPSHAQLQQPFVFAAELNGPGPGILVWTRNDASGVLTPVAGSPFPSREPVNRLTLDFKGRFLFVATSLNHIEMFSVDPNTGALQEVPNSPFASPHTSSPAFLSTESSGQFLYVVNFNGSKPGVSAVESFLIDPVNLNLAPTAAGSTDLPGLFAGGATHPSGKSFYVFCNDPNSLPSPDEPFFLLFNSSNGTFTTPIVFSLNSNSAKSLAMDPQGLHIALGTAGQIVSQDLQLDGTLGASNVPIAVTGSPDSLSFDPLGQFLYATILAPGNPTPSVHFYSATMLQELPNSPLPSAISSTASWLPDPTAPLIYANNVYQVDPQTGLLNSILSPDPLPTPFFGSTFFSRPPGSQPVVGPAALLNSMSFSFGTLPTGQTTNPQTLTILSNGGQALSLNSFAFSGANPADFAIASDTCHVPAAFSPGQSCSVLLSFTPSASGSRTATFTLTDNASPSTESVQLTGTGLAPSPAVSLAPASLDFGTVTQGTSTPLSISVKNSGNAPLHISSIALGGADANDFSSSSPTCTAAIPSNSTCTISVTFTPIAQGLRSATITLTDDAADSPQIISVKGDATAPASSAVTVNPASPDFGTTTQGTSTPLNVTVSNSGTAALHISSAVLGGSNASEFSFSDPACSAAIPAGGSCTIVLTFAPVSAGAHVVSLALTDDAPGSPHVINIKGTANPAVSVGPASGGSTSASVSAGQTAQFQLQLTPGPGYSGTVSLACSGAPLGAVCHAPTSLAVANGVAAAFTVTVSTSGSATVLLPSLPKRFLHPSAPPTFIFLVLVAIVLRMLKKAGNLDAGSRVPRLAWSSTLAAAFVCTLLYAAGCGAASSPVVTVPPPVITPAGTSTITLTPTAMSSTGQPLQLQPIPLTLTVK